MDTIEPQEKPDTYFAPARRASTGEVADMHRRVLTDHMLSSLLDALPDYVLILNRERQLVAANTRLLDAFGITSVEEVLGKRPGELIGCMFSSEGPSGCGTDPHCSVCGAVMSILESQDRVARSCHECRITLNRDGGISLDLEVISNPATVDGIPVTVCILRDIGDQKRRTILERVFFHDVINTAGGIHGIASMLVENQGLSPEKESEYKGWMVHLSNRLIDEINHHRKLLAAEKGEFKPELGMVDVVELLREVHALYVNHDIVAGRHLVLGTVTPCTIESDVQILRRILGNLVKNALEATPRDGTVTLSCLEDGDRVTFAVTNPGVMPTEVQLQIFQRSFSTKKGTGRGIGTYSVRLFGERYLKGNVDFSSDEHGGTTFRVSIPKHFT
ncbi:MAG: GHKL domain-containing protein [Desulfuromonadales bacterium]|nr:MAG: GHKL domain-containing protein [Desulfuromonadales bacterium]